MSSSAITPRQAAASPVVALVFGLLTALLLSVLLTLFRSGFVAEKAETLPKQFGWKLLYGLIAFAAVPIGALIAMITVIAIPISVIVLVIYGVVMYLSPVITGVILGRYFLKKLNRYLSAMIGAFAMALLALIPIVGVIVFFGSAFYTLGILLPYFKPHRQPPVRRQSRRSSRPSCRRREVLNRSDVRSY